MIRFLIAAALLISSVSCTRYNTGPIRILDDLGIDYEIVEKFGPDVKAAAYYDPIEDKITFQEGQITAYLIFHEVVHSLRIQGDITNYDSVEERRKEEAIAVVAGYRLCKLARVSPGFSAKSLGRIISKTLVVNGLPTGPFSKEEKIYIDKEVQNTIKLFIEKLEGESHKIDEIDWVTTALLILI